MLKDKGWTQEELAMVTGRSRQSISGIVSGRTGLTPDMARALGAVFGNDPADWLRWAAEYDLAFAESTIDLNSVERLTALYEYAPIRDMQKRGWIAPVEGEKALEQELTRFYGYPIDGALSFPLAARRTIKLTELNPSERAWCFRARQLAQMVPGPSFHESRLPTIEKELRKAAAFAKDARSVPRILQDNGIRFVVVELLPGGQMDGAAFWLDEQSPVIAVSIRFDRIDSFWFTVMHEFSHIKHGDSHSFDANLVGVDATGASVMLADSDVEAKANEAAADSLIPDEEMESFIRRLAPYYSRDRVIQFANRLRIHPGIVVGQLHRREQIGYSALREFLVKVRAIVTSTALTDGWGQTISPGFI